MPDPTPSPTPDRPARDGERIPMARLAPGGPGSTDALGWCARGAALALLLAIGWLVFAALRPLAPAVETSPPRVSAARAIQPQPLSVAERTALLTDVTSSNWYAPDRRMWTYEDQQALLAKAEDAKPGGAGGKGEDSEAKPEDEPPGSIRVTSVENLPSDLAKAFKNLDLLGIRSTADGGMLAMITFVGGVDRPATTPYAVGDTFTDPQHAKEPWKVVVIDATLDRVFLRREGTTVVLPLFSGSAATVAHPSDEAEPAPDPGAVGVSREEVVSQLRAAGITDEEIAELLRLADADLEDAAKPAADASIEKKSESLASREDSAGMAEVLNMMKSTKPTVRPVETPENERADTYESPGRGKSIASVDTLAGVVTLSDGSEWAVGSAEAEKIAKWPENASVSVYPARRAGRPYVIVNEVTRAFSPASHIAAPEGAEPPLEPND